MFDAIFDVFRRRAETARQPPPTPPGFVPKIERQDSDDMLGTAEEPGDVAGIPLAIVYCDAKGATTKRRVTCRRIDDRGDVIYLQARCHERKAYRTFRFDRIAEIVDWRTGEVIDPPARFLEMADAWSAAEDEAAEARRAVADAKTADQRRAMGRCRDGIRVLMFLARCDGEFHPLEREVVADYCTARLAGHEDMLAIDADIAKIMTYADRQYPDADLFLKAARQIFGKASAGRHVRLILDSASRLIDADGVVAQEEFDFGLELRELARRYV